MSTDFSAECASSKRVILTPELTVPQLTIHGVAAQSPFFVQLFSYDPFENLAAVRI
jgi:hypothetical protein